MEVEMGLRVTPVVERVKGSSLRDGIRQARIDIATQTDLECARVNAFTLHVSGKKADGHLREEFDHQVQLAYIIIASRS